MSLSNCSPHESQRYGVKNDTTCALPANLRIIDSWLTTASEQWAK